MAARGTIAKVEVMKRIQEVFGKDFLGECDKKLYVQVPENGEMVQIAIALTCPKNPVAVSAGPVVSGGRMDFEAENTLIAPTATAEITDDERETIAELMRKCGL